MTLVSAITPKGHPMDLIYNDAARTVEMLLTRPIPPEETSP